MPFRRLEDHIRELCAVAAAAKDGELQAIHSELKSSLSEHTERLRNSAFMDRTRDGPPSNTPVMMY
jgi:hypothetical protein